MGFLELRQEPLIYSRVTAGMAIQNSTLFSEVRTPVYLGRTPQESKLVCRIIQTFLEVRWETKRPFLVSTEILGFLSIFKKSQALAHFEGLNSVGLTTCHGM